ncbi:fasciclin domain-containing protein [Mangrovibacterium sp.]|uniref:fasciclin domain-containing protein n=1 Tax=Mangrovibacterium sp. TaxID=1961364 RepID=UPI0035660196
MRTKKKRFLLIIVMFIGLLGCEEKIDPFFAPPDDLEGTIYETLEARGNFTNYLKCLDRTSYAAGLQKSGSWTVFAPDDEAFEAFLKENGYSSVDELPWKRATDIVKFSIILDAYNTTTLTYYKSQWYAGSAFRRYTQLVDSIIDVDSKDYPNFQDWTDRTYKLAPRGSQVLSQSYFIQEYFDSQTLNPEDYEFLFPGESYSGSMRVADANVTEENVITENGLIFILDKVVEPRENLYQNLVSEENTGSYTIFKNMIDRFGSFSFKELVDNPVTGQQDSIFQLSFLTGITSNYPAYNPNSETYPALKNNVDRTYANAVGLFAPTDQALTEYLSGNSLLGRYYDSYDDMPLDVVGIVINMNFIMDFWDMCPGHYGSLFNIGFELLEMSESNVVDQKWCSNGMFVGIDKVFTPTTFATCLGPLVLDANYSIMNKMIEDLGIDNSLTGSGIDITVVGLKNDQIVDMPDPNSPYRRVTVVGYNEDLSVIYLSVTGDPTAANNRIYPDPTATTVSSTDVTYVNTTLKSIVLNQIIDEPVDRSEDNFYQTRSGEFVKVTNNGSSFAGGGDIAAGTASNLVEDIETTNGHFLVMDGPVIRPTRYTYGALTDNPDEFSKFLEVLDGADAKVAISGFSSDYLIGFLDLRKSYTLLAPNNAAVQQAITDGVIPDPASLSSMEPVEKATAVLSLQKFAKKHFIQQAIPTDGSTTGSFSSLFVDKIIDYVPVYKEFTVYNDHATMSLEIMDTEGTTLLAKTGGKVNILSKMVVIHEIDSYLK